MLQKEILHMMKRNEQKIENTWNLKDIYKNDEQFLEDLDKEMELSKEMESFSNQLNDPEKLYEYLTKLEQLTELIDNTYGYANLLSDQDTSDSLHQQYLGKAYSTAIQIEAAQSFADVQILELEEETINDPRLKRFKHYIQTIRRMKEHTLSEKEERLLSSSMEALSASSQTFNMLNNSDMHFKDAIDKNGKKHPLSSATFIDLMQSQDETLRKSAFENLYESYKQLGHTYASLLDGQMKQLKFIAQSKMYQSPLDAALYSNEVDTSVYKNLINTVHQDIGYLHDYMRLRKKMLGKEKLHMYDLYVPIVDEDKNVSFEQAKEEAYQSIQIYGKEYADIYKKGLNERWIDIYPNEGKQSGAYSSGMLVHPYMLLNHTDTLDSEFTLAHEMGHSMHSYLSNTHQNPLERQYKIFVAEVASTCNEALLMHYLREHSDNDAYLINYFLEQYRTTLYRQTMFAEFELKCSELVQDGQTLTVDVLNKIYHDLNEFYYGPDVIIDDYIDYEWMRIPHFYYNFYVYQYATGFSAAMTLSQKMLKGTKQDVQDYLNFLSAGCSQPPIDLLKMAGVDLTTPQPIHEALVQFGQLIKEFEATENS